MSDPRSSEDLIQTLTDDLSPVTPIPKLRSVAAVLVLLWLGVAVAGTAALGLQPGFVEMLLHASGVTAVFGGLVVTGLGGLVATLAMSVPGRDRLVRAALSTSALGMAVAAGVGTLLFLQSPLLDGQDPPSSHLACLATACVVGLLPALGVIWFAGRAAPHRPLVLVLAAAAGTAALGAATAQASCPHDDVHHLMLGHILAPIVGAVVLSLPLLLALRRFRR